MQNLCSYCMQPVSMPYQYNPMDSMAEQQLESMYPKTYRIILPVAESVCDEVEKTCSHAHTPSQEQLESMIDDVCSKVEVEIDIEIHSCPDNSKDRQLIGGGRRLLRDFIGALLISNLIRRRRRHHYGFPGYGMGLYGPSSYSPFLGPLYY